MVKRKSTISKAWKSKKRTKTSLAQRTMLANREAIKKLKGTIETNMVESNNATLANRYSGQWFANETVDIKGQNSTNIPLVMRPLRGVVQGTTSADRSGDKVSMNSLTYRVAFTATSGAVPDAHNNCGMLVVLDRCPNTQAPNLMGGAPGGTVPDAGTLLGGQSSNAYLMFQNLETCGKDNRYKILKHHKFLIQPVVSSSVSRPIHTINNTLKLPYTIQYAPGGGVPTNQELLFFFYSSSAVAPHPTVSVYCRYRFKDA